MQLEWIRSQTRAFMVSKSIKTTIASDKDIRALQAAYGEHQTHDLLTPQNYLEVDLADQQTGLAVILFHILSYVAMRPVCYGETDRMQRKGACSSNARFRPHAARQKAFSKGLGMTKIGVNRT